MLYLLVIINVVSSFTIQSNHKLLNCRIYCIKDIVIDSSRQDSILLFGRLADTKVTFCPEQFYLQEPYSHSITNITDNSKDPKWSKIFLHNSESLKFDTFIDRLSSLSFYWPINLDGSIVESGIYSTLVNTLFTKSPTGTLIEQLTGRYKHLIHTRGTVRSTINKLLSNSPIPHVQSQKLFNLICGSDHNLICKRDIENFISTFEPKFGPISFNIFETILDN